MPMDADRQDGHDRMVRHDRNLNNGRKEDIPYIAHALSDVCVVVKKLLATDFVKTEDLANHCRFKDGCLPDTTNIHKSGFWPKTPLELISFVILVGSLCTTAYKILGE